VASETGIDEELLTCSGFGAFEKENSRGKVVDVRNSEAHEALGKFMPYHLHIQG
jgi:hypothetical protein